MSEENKQRVQESKEAAHTIFMKDGRISPFKRVQPTDKQLTAIHISSNNYGKKQESGEPKNRQSKVLSIIESLNEGNQVDTLGIWGEGRTANSFNVKAQQALQPFRTLQENENVMFFDIEALGTPKHARGIDSAEFFNITELSFDESVFYKGNYKNQGGSFSIAIKPTDKQAKMLVELLDSLEKNTSMSLSKDVKRSLLDLAKYSEAKNFIEDQRAEGKTYTQIKKHSRALPKDTAISVETVKEMRKGLDNLVNKGTPLEDAMTIFHSRVKRTNSRLAGYNIQAYDIPSLIETASNQTLERFFKDKSRRALDFYQGYNGIVENPLTSTGSGMRLEDVYKALLGKVDEDGNPIIRRGKDALTFHMASDDNKATMAVGEHITERIFNHFEQNKSNPSDFMFNGNRINTNPIKVGDTLFSFRSGAFDEKKDKHSLIGRVIDGQTVARWDNIDSSMPTYESFKVESFFKDVRLSDDPKDTRKGVGVRLKSVDVDDKDIYLFAETVDDLADRIHQRFKKYDTNNHKEAMTVRELRKVKVKHEAPANRYKKMFQAGGFKRMEHYLSSVDEYSSFALFEREQKKEIRKAETKEKKKKVQLERAKTEKQKQRIQQELDEEIGKKQKLQKELDERREELKKKVIGPEKSHGSIEFYNELPHFAERMNSEEGAFWKNVVQEINKSDLNDDQKDVAIQYIKKQLDKHGENKGKVTAVGAKMFNFRFGREDETVFNARDTDGIKGTIHSFIYGRRNDERVGEPEVSYKRARIKDLNKLIHSNFNLYNDKNKSKEVRKITNRMIELVNNGERIGTAVTELSNIVRNLVERDGEGTYVREVMNRVTKRRKHALEVVSENLEEHIQASIKHASSLVKPENLQRNNVLQTILDEQDERIKKLFHRNFGARQLNNKDVIDKAIGKASKYSDLVNEILDKFSYDFDTQLHMDENGKLYMVLNKSGSGQKTYAPKTLNEAWKSASTAVIELPTFQENLGVSYGRELKVPIIKSGYTSKDILYHSTSVTDALYQLLNSNARKELLMEGKPNIMAELEQRLNTAVRQAVEPYASSYATYDDIKQYLAQSEVALYTKSGNWDISGLASEWYKEKYVPRLGKEKESVEKIKARARNTNQSFFDAMGQDAQLMFQPKMVEFAKEVTKLQGTMHGSTPGQSSKGIIQTGAADARAWMAFGNYYADAGENPNKTRNYRPLKERYVSRVFNEKQSYRYRNSLVASGYNPENVGEEIRGITVQSGYMTDHEIAARLKNAEVRQKMKDAVDEDETLSAAEKRKMKKRIDNYMLSTNEGLAMMDYKLFKAYTAVEEKRIKLGSDSIKLNQNIESKLKLRLDQQYGEGYFEKGEWRQKGFKLDKPMYINVKDLLNEEGVLTIGRYMVNDTSDSAVENRAFRVGDKVTLNQLDIDGDNAILVFNRIDDRGHGLKIVTEGGQRVTMTPMVKGAIEALYGQEGIDQVLTHLSESKGAFDLPALIRGYETNIRQQLNGEFDQSDWIRGLLDKGYTESDVLQEYYKNVRAHFDNLKEEDLYFNDKDNRAYVNPDLGLDGDTNFSWKDRETFSKNMQKKLNLKREIFGDINLDHLAWYRQGGLNNGKYTMKELTMLDLAYERAGITEPGQKSEHIKFIHSMISGELAQQDPEVRLRQKEFRNVVKAASEFDRKWEPKAGDVVIDYTSSAPGIEGDIDAVNKNGIVYVSPDKFEHIPSTSAGKGQKWTMQDYARTIIKSGEVEFTTADMPKQKIEDYLGGTKGLTYMKLQIAGEEHFVPVIDTVKLSFEGRDKVGFVDDLTSHYSTLEKAQYDINNTFVGNGRSEADVTAIKKRKEESMLRTISSLKETIGRYTSSKGAAKELTSSRLPMSSQFQTAGINAVASYEYDSKNETWTIKAETGMDEGTMALNRKNVRDMIENKEHNFIKSWGKDVAEIEEFVAEQVGSGRKGYTITDWVLDNWNENDTYVSTVRYPSISSGTNQVLKLKIDNTVGVNQAKIARGTASRIKADWDGDNLAAFLTHYGIDDDKLRSKVLDELQGLQKHDKKLNEFALQLEMNSQKAEFESKLTDHLSGIVDEKHLSDEVKKISKAHFSDTDVYQTVGDQAILDAYESAIQSSEEGYENWGINKVGKGAVALEEYTKTMAARSNFAFVGNVDSIRMRLTATHRSIARVKYDAFNNHENADIRYTKRDYLHKTALVDEFYREFSQKAISSKKMKLTSEQASAVVTNRIEGLMDMIHQLGEPNSGMDKNKIIDYLIDEIGMYEKVSGKETHRINYEFGETIDGKFVAGFDGSRRELISQALDEVIMVESTLKETMGTNSRGLSSTMFAAGSGFGSLGGLVDVYNNGQILPHDRSGEEAMMYASEEQMKVIKENQKIIIEDIQRKHIHDVEKTIVAQSENATIVGDIMNTHRKQAGQVLENGDIAIHRTIGDRLSSDIDQVGKKIKGSINSSAMGMLAAGAMGFMGLWGSGSLMGKTPTPEGVQQAAAPAPETLGAPPTARVTPNQNGEYINISIKASNARNMSPHDIAAMVNNEIMSQSGVTMNHNVMVSDNSQNINSQWMQEAVANSMNKGYAY